jgi:CHC2 zinc finger/Toprim domain
MGNPFLDYAAETLGTATGGLIPQHVVDAIHDAVPPSVVIGKYVRLAKAGRQLRGMSPFNKERTPSFYVNDAKRFWHCFSSNQGGGVFEFLVKTQRMSFPEAVRYCGNVCGIVVPSNGAHAVAPMSIEAAEAAARAAAEREERRREEAKEQAKRERRNSNYAKAIARGSRAFQMLDGSPPALFFESRGLVMAADMSPRALLYHPRCPFRDDADNEVFHHALIGLYRDVLADKVMAISRRPLTRDGQSLAKPVSLGPTRGCAIKLTADEDVTHGLHLAEGVTSALAAAMIGMTPIWATGGTGNMGKFPVLAGVDCLTLIADNAENGASQSAANECFGRWKSAGREVWTVISDTVGTDMGDVVQNGKVGRHGG